MGVHRLLLALPGVETAPLGAPCHVQAALRIHGPRSARAADRHQGAQGAEFRRADACWQVLVRVDEAGHGHRITQFPCNRVGLPVRSAASAPAPPRCAAPAAGGAVGSGRRSADTPRPRMTPLDRLICPPARRERQNRASFCHCGHRLGGYFRSGSRSTKNIRSSLPSPSASLSTRKAKNGMSTSSMIK